MNPHHLIHNRFEGDYTYSQDPMICVVEDFIDAQLCDHLIMTAKPKMARATVASNGQREISSARTNQMAFLSHALDPKIQALVSRIADLISFPVSHAEDLQLISYGCGQQYKPHFDTFDMDDPAQRGFLGKSGQRLLTALMYLNDVEAGGATIFPELGVEVSPLKGRLVIFQTCEDASNVPNMKSRHGGEPVEKGEKWAANLWFRERPFQPVRSGSIC